MTKNKKTKVALFHCGFIYSGGGERIVLEEARGLKKRGYDVEVYAPTLDKKNCYPEMVEELDVKTFLPSLVDSLPLKNAIRMMVTSILAPFFAYKFRDTDVFVGANQPGAWLAFCISKVLGKPYMVYLNQPNRVVYPRPVDKKYGWYTTVKDYQFLFKFFQILRPIVYRLDRMSIASADEVLVNGHYIGGVIENVYTKRTVDAPAGAYHHAMSKLYVNPHTAYSGTIKVKEEKIRKPFALITNRHDPQKRFDYVIKAMKKVLTEYGDAKLVIPGPFTNHTKKLISLANELEIENEVLFLGKIDEKDLQRLYHHAAVYCYPSPEEDFGLGPIEAGGWGVPTVAWGHGGPTVTVGDSVTGFLAEPYDIEDYAEKMLKLFKNQKLRAKMGKAAWKRTKEEFSWKNHVDVLEESIASFV